MNPFIQTSLSLLVVLAIIVGFAFILKRIQQKLPGNSSLIQIKSSVSLGPKERLALVEINHQWILIGITNSSINHIITLQNAPDMETNLTQPKESWLQKYLPEKKS
jgi:flagellar protein FliO/FliZ